MSLTPTTAEPTRPVTEPAAPSGDSMSDAAATVRRVLLVWDAPNLDMGLGSILGRRPTALERPRFDALGRWLLA
ncbi:MAG: NYN domain-containing protein, partial [Mycobacterium sp.]